METLLLNKSEVGSLIDLEDILESVENGYRSFSSGLVVQPDFMTIVKPGTHTGFDFKGGLDLGGGYITIKSSSGGYPDNPKIGLPTGMNTVFLYEADTSALKCIMDGTWITGCRTAAAGAISVKYLSRKDSSSICIIGAGNQGRRQLRAMARVRNITDVYVWGYSEDEITSYIADMSPELHGIKFHPCSSAEEGIRKADIVVTATIGRRAPIVKREWLKPGTHIAAIGADMPDKQELCTDVFKGAKVVNDSIKLCVKNGETHHAVDEGVIKVEEIYAEIGDIILGKKPGRENDDEITIFDTVGMAIQDNVTAVSLYNMAVKKGLGVKYDFLK